jgi:hypothetical protein
MTALYANPLLASLMSGKSDLARGLIGTLDTSTLSQLFGNSEAQVTRLQRAGLIRDDIPAGLVMFLMGALKMGIISASEIAPKGQAPTVDQLTEGLSDLIRRWLQPEGKREDGAEGKKIMAEWMESYRTIGMTRRRTED